MLRVLVCGGRDFTDAETVRRVLDALHASEGVACVIQGVAKGADALAAQWARDVGVFPVQTYHADWRLHGRAAGPIRNARMLAEGRPDLVLAFPGGRGTKDMTTRAQLAGVPVRFHE